MLRQHHNGVLLEVREELPGGRNQGKWIDAPSTPLHIPQGEGTFHNYIQGLQGLLGTPSAEGPPRSMDRSRQDSAGGSGYRQQAQFEGVIPMVQLIHDPINKAVAEHLHMELVQAEAPKEVLTVEHSHKR